jgi:hypothetical protein
VIQSKIKEITVSTKDNPISKRILNALPVAPEFVSVLEEHAVETALAYLRAANAPQELIDVVDCVSELNYYLIECYRDPKGLMKDRRDRFDIESIVIEAVNAIARLGGEFRGPIGDTIPREDTVLAEKAE